MNNYLYLHSIIVISLYFLVFSFVYFYKRDKFFIRQKATKHTDIYICLVTLSCLLFIIWNNYFPENLFLGLTVSKDNSILSDKFIALLSVYLAVIGWLYTIRSQSVTSMRNHSIQTIMNARLSECYNNKVDAIYEILKDFSYLTLDQYEALKEKDKAVIHYILNYYESIAISIRYHETDEKIIKSMMRSQVVKSFITFEEIILNANKNSPNMFENFIALYNRWVLKDYDGINKDKLEPSLENVA